MNVGPHLEWPWLLLLLPLPVLVRWLFKSAPKNHRQALITPFYGQLARAARSDTPAGTPPTTLRTGLVWLLWVLLVAALARPQWLTPPQETPVSGRDLVLAVDLSGSMEMADFELNGQRVDRLTAVKAVAGEFLRRRVGDRLGLILFGSRAYLQTPLTFDRDTVARMLDESEIGLAGEKTAIGDAIGLAIKRLRERPQQARLLILLTDGTNTAGSVHPLKAAEMAQQEGIRIHTIGIGSDKPMVVDTIFGQRRVNTARELDEKSLTAIARATGGRYFRASDTRVMEEIYQELDAIEPVSDQVERFVRRQELYIWFLGPALILSLLMATWFAGLGRLIRQIGHRRRV